jgi:DNA replication and repair protein RecF
VVRAEGDRDGRHLLIEGELHPGGRTRVQINRQPLRRASDLLGALRVTVFAPDDLILVKGGPSERRRYLDGLLVAGHPKWEQLRSEVDRILRQRATLLKQAGGRLSAEVASTLDVWDAKLAASGTELAEARAELLDDLGPAVATAYDQLAGEPAEVVLSYVAAWRPPAGPGLAEALVHARNDDVRRGVSTVGPHRDDVVISLGGLPARTHGSQGEQRSMALALRLGGHAVVTKTVGSPPVLLLDDVFSELDPSRTTALVAHLPYGQAVLTTAALPPTVIKATSMVRIQNGRIVVPD